MHSRPISSWYAIALIALMLVAGCSDDDGPAGGGPGDTTAPSIGSVTAIDANHVDVVFSEPVQRGSAEASNNYGIVQGDEPILREGDAKAAPGDPLDVYSAALSSDGRTVTLTTATMFNASYEMTITRVKDLNGNTIAAGGVQAFNGSDDPDETPPAIVYRSPAPGATGVQSSAILTMTFSEPVNGATFVGGFSLSSGGGDVEVGADSEDGVHVVVFPLIPLELNTEYTASLTGLQDESGNTMPDESWTFRTASTPDTTPPSVVSSTPSDGATNVNPNTALSLTFSEPVNPYVSGINLYPEVGEGDVIWSDGGRVITFTPEEPLALDTQFVLSIAPGALFDFAGNSNTSLVQIRFSTGPTLDSGSISGLIAGDPESNFAADPTGARVMAVYGEFEGFEDIQVVGSGTVATNDTYTMSNLSDGEFFVIAIKNTFNDGTLDPLHGDAFGLLGADYAESDFEAATASVVGGGAVTNQDFPLFDPSAISGTVAYSGPGDAGEHLIGIGLFNAATFDPMNPEPDYTSEGYWPYQKEWVFIDLEHGFPHGSYYVGAFLDTNDNETFDFTLDPIGIYGGIESPTAINIADGSDRGNIVITLESPDPTLVGNRSVAWKQSVKRDLPAWLKNVARKTSGAMK